MAEYFKVRLHYPGDDEGIVAWEKEQDGKVVGYFDRDGKLITEKADSVTYVSRAACTPPFEGGDK